jgi:RND family efflux transporter MFP subunit
MRRRLACLTGAVALLLALPVPVRAETEAHACIIDPSLTVNLGGPVAGTLEAVLVARGDEVRVGDVVARLSSVVERETERLLEMQAENDSAIVAQETRLAFLRGRMERTRQLVERGVTAQDVLDELSAEVETSISLLRQAETDRAIARQELARARAALAQRDIRSPVDGLVTEVVLSAGEYLPADGHVVSIVRLDPLFVEAFLPVSVYDRVRSGDRFTVRPMAPFEGMYAATVEVVDRVFDAASATFAVRLTLQNAVGELPAGHRCELLLIDPGPSLRPRAAEIVE